MTIGTIRAHTARAWGRKAAQQGLPETCCPYRDGEERRAWESAYRAERTIGA